MKRTFCDKCEQQITEENQQKEAEINIGKGKYIVTIYPRIDLKDEPRYGRDKIPEEHHICINCIIDAFNNLDKRPKAAHKS